MGAAIGQVLSYAIGVTISPVPIIAVVLMLATQRARANGAAFIVGWIAGLAVVGTIVLLAASGGGASDQGAPATWLSWLKIALGVLLALVAFRQWQGRPEAGEESELPKWMQTLDSFTPLKAAGAGALLAGINPKNLLLTVGATAAIAQTGASSGSQAVALIVFIAIATLGVGIPVVIYFTMGERGVKLLASLKTWMGVHNSAIMAVLCLVIAMKLVGDGITGLS